MSEKMVRLRLAPFVALAFLYVVLRPLGLLAFLAPIPQLPRSVSCEKGAPSILVAWPKEDPETLRDVARWGNDPKLWQRPRRDSGMGFQSWEPALQFKDEKLARRIALKRTKEEEAELIADLPWPRETAEIMIDAMSIVRWYWQKTKMVDEDLVKRHDMHTMWPLKTFNLVKNLVSIYGDSREERPPSPWTPIICVFDLPNPKKTFSGLQVRKWMALKKQGPRFFNGTTMAFAWTYVDKSAAEHYRCDHEIMYMLELLTRDYPRRQVLVTWDTQLQRDARRYCTVRGPEWLEREIQLTGPEGEEAIKVMEGGGEPLSAMRFLKFLPDSVKEAFTAA